MIVIDDADVYQLSYTGAQTNAFIGTPYAAQTFTGSVVVNASTGAVTITGQKGQALANLGIGSLATMSYTVIV